MRLLKIIVVVFIIYFIRRFIQLYKVMKQIQENQQQNASRAQGPETEEKKSSPDIIEADFKVVK